MLSLATQYGCVSERSFYITDGVCKKQCEQLLNPLLTYCNKGIGNIIVPVSLKLAICPSVATIAIEEGICASWNKFPYLYSRVLTTHEIEKGAEYKTKAEGVLVSLELQEM